MNPPTALEQDFMQLAELAATLEGITVPLRLVQRLGRAYSRAIEKALSVSWDHHITDVGYVNRSLMRHARRGVEDYLA